MNEFIPETYFVDGGTLRANTPSYVKRPADDELFEALLNREYCYILTPRQMGKSSLMIRTSQRLKERNIQSAVVDIQGIGTNKIREWYASLLSRIRRGLRLNIDVDEWMAKKSSVGFGQMFSDFIQDVVLTQIADPIVIFLDEVDWMIKIDFRDDFFASIRSMYNARAEYPEFTRISFVLLGVASPADLISEPTRTPFNIGHSIALQELSFEDAVPLRNGLEQVCPGEGEQILGRIFYWTNGHPYLTQKICKTIAETGKKDWPDSAVDDLVNRLFLAEEARREANLKFIQDRILSNEQIAQLLRLYKSVRQTKIKESGQSVVENQLMLSGLLTSRDGYLEVRNRIYRTVFNESWINRYMPKNWQRTALAAMGSIIVLLIAVLGYNYTVGLRLKTLQSDYINHDPAQKISDLAGIYRLHYLFFSNTDIDAAAAQTFYDFTPNSQTQLSLFPIYGFHEPGRQDDLVIVIQKLYVTLANVDEENDNTSLIQAMQYALQESNMKDGPGNTLKDELDGWFRGRTAYNQKDYIAALQGYTDAISLNPSNQATLYERAKVFIALGQYSEALKDLDAAIGAAKQSAPDIPPSPTPTSSPIPPTDTPVTQISETRALTNSTTTQITDSASTKTTTPSGGISATQVSNGTPTPRPSSAPDLTITPVPTQPVPAAPDKFESNFTTLNHVLVAVKALVDETPELQDALQPPVTGYSNLNSVGLVKAYPTLIVRPSVDQNVLYQDDFTDPASGWPEDVFDNFSIGYHEPDYYYVQINSSNYKTTVFMPNGQTYIDATVEAKVMTSPDKTSQTGDFCYGIVFRRSGDQFYAFTISPRTKTWLVLKSSASELVVFDEGTEESIQDVNGQDVLRVDTQGPNFIFLINDKVVSQVTDSEYATGEVGLYVQTFDAAQVSINFDSLVVKSLETPVLNSDFINMAQIPSGTYEVGSTSTDDYHSAVQNITLNDFWIDKYQVTNAQYQQFLNETGAQTPQVWPAGANHPVRGVTYDQAVEYCSWAGKRLPSEAEWEVAGRGPSPNPSLYPWGNDPTTGGDALSLPDRDTYEVGNLPFNKSVFGVYDMVGNIWEWVGDPYANVPDGLKILRGSRFGLPILDLAYRVLVVPDDASYVPYAGFRCAMSASLETGSTQAPSATQQPTLTPMSTNKIIGGADKIAFVANNEIWLMNVDGSELTQLTFDGAVKTNLQWLPGGEELLFLSGKTVKYYDINNDTISTLTSFPSANSLDGFSISPDGTMVSISIDSQLIILPFDLDLLSNVTSTFLLQKLDNLCLDYADVNVKGAQWSADGTTLAIIYKGIVGQQIGDTIRIMNVSRCQNADPLILDEFPGVRFLPTGYTAFPVLPSYDWDGNELFTFNTSVRNDGWGDFYFYNWNTHKPTHINPINNTCCYRDARWSPDGTYIFFAYQDVFGSTIELYYVPLADIGSGQPLTPMNLPNGFFSTSREKPQPALRPNQ